MCRTCITWRALGALGPVLLAGLAHGSDLPQVNQLEGTVVSKDDGRTVAGVPVVMAHGTRGYLSLDDQGALAQASNERLFGVFPVPNGRYACMTVTDADGHFVLRDFAAPEERWLITAGDAEHGYALETRIKPKDFASRPLRLELEKPSFIGLRPPKAQADTHAYIVVGLARDPEARDSEDSAVTDEDEPSEHVAFRSAAMWRADAGKPRRLGPLPGGQWYKVTAQSSSGNLPYTAVLFERLVKVAPGETAEVTLEPEGGVTVSGRVSDSDDKPLSKVNVTVKTADAFVIGAVSDQDGEYELRGVPPGTHTLRLLRHAKRTAPG
jgi:hypothetical protein